jgi:antirestriction protein ArdC
MSSPNLTPAQRQRQTVRHDSGRYAPTMRRESTVSLTADNHQQQAPGPGTVPAADGDPAGVGGGPAFPDRPEALTRRYDSVDDKVAACRAEVEETISHLDENDNWQNYLHTMSKFHRYSRNNQLLIMAQTGGRASRVAGFKKWQTDFGRNVKKGEKGIIILAPKAVSKTQTDDDGNPVVDDQGKPVKRKQVVGFTGTSVFDVSQTEGDPVRTLPYDQLSEQAPDGFCDDLTESAQQAGYTVRYEPRNSMQAGGAHGWTDFTSQEIVVDADLNEATRAQTLAHELGHIYAGHQDQTEAGQYHTGTGGCRGRMETEAESIGYTLTRANGMSADGTKITAPYVQGWSHGDPDVLRQSADTVSTAVHTILESTSFRNAEN